MTKQVFFNQADTSDRVVWLRIWSDAIADRGKDEIDVYPCIDASTALGLLTVHHERWCWWHNAEPCIDALPTIEDLSADATEDLMLCSGNYRVSWKWGMLGGALVEEELCDAKYVYTHLDGLRTA